MEVSDWIETKKQLPPLNQCVLGVQLSQFVNAEWEYSIPYPVIRHADGSYSGPYARPDYWMPIVYPLLPVCAARTKALVIARLKAEAEQRIKAIEAEMQEKIDGLQK
jgi:hypothetical protein